MIQFVPEEQLAVAEFQLLSTILDNPTVKKYIKSLQAPLLNEIIGASKSEGETQEEFYLRVENVKGIVYGLQMIHDIQQAPAPIQPQPGETS